jgi:serine/threonine-protein kinase
MGEVHLGVLEAPGGVRRLAAVKFTLQARRELGTALFAEARLAALLSHPNVAQLFDAGIDGDRPWFAMEYVPGLSLSEFFDLELGRVPAWTWVRILADACAAVHAVHEARDEHGAPLNIVHRDVTPHNLLVSWDGFMKLVDFGIARSSLQSTLTTTGVVKGKLGYMSPEQATGGTVDRRTDVFALGILLWEALARKRLFRRGTDSETIAAIVMCKVPPLDEVAAEAPKELRPILERALRHDPSGRYSTALEMQRALEQALVSAGVAIGTNEVAHIVQHVAPSRVREHERWLADFLTSTTARIDAPDSRKSGAPRRAAEKTRSWALGLSLAVTAGGVAYALQRMATQPAAASVSELSRAAQALPSSRLSGSPRLVPPAPPAAPAPAAPLAAASAVTPAATNTAIEHRLPAPAASKSFPAPSALEARGTLHVSSWPSWAKIRIDGTTRGSTPLVIRDLTPGSHVIEALALGNEPARKRTVSIASGGTEHVEFQFDP